MRPLETIRNKAFWFIDFLKGNPVLKNYKDIKYLNQNYGEERSIALRGTYLKTLLKHVSSTVPYYKNYETASCLQEFPVVNKVIIKENYEAFTSTDNRFKIKHKVATSGSTGTPFKLYQDSQKRYRNVADAIYFAEKAGVKVGMEVYFLRVWNEMNIKNPLLSWMQNVKMQDIANFNAEEITKFVNNLSKNNYKKGIWSYASSLDNIANYIKSGHKIPKCNLSSIVACSEYLNLETKKIVQEHFKTAVISRYSNAENGIFAQQKPFGSDDFYLNWASYYFEILKFDEDVPAANGELGRVVITDLFNYYMPIIRYDTGDVACLDYNENQIPVFRSIEGRKLDLIYNTKGELISSLTITGFMMKYIDVVQFQFIQEHQKKYTIKLNTSKSFNDENSLILDVKNVLGSDSIIKIEYVDEVPLLDSGKRKIIINNYKE